MNKNKIIYTPLKYFITVDQTHCRKTCKQTTCTCVSAPQQQYSARCSAAMLTHLFAVKGGITGWWAQHPAVIFTPRRRSTSPPPWVGGIILDHTSLPRALMLSSSYHEGAPGFRAASIYPRLFKYIRVIMFHMTSGKKIVTAICRHQVEKGGHADRIHTKS